MALKRDMPAEVSDAAIAALNAKLKTASVSNFSDVIQETKTFMEPLITALKLNPLQSASPTTDTLPPAETMVIEGTPLIPPLAIETPSPQSLFNNNAIETQADLGSSAKPPYDESSEQQVITQRANGSEESIDSKEAHQPSPSQTKDEEATSNYSLEQEDNEYADTSPSEDLKKN